jgi:methionyl-tRNA synthetase
MKTFYITTAIDYANGRPHLGHAYEKVLTDVVARSRRMRGDKVRFLTGIDEHGQKVTQTAEKLGKTAAELTNELAPFFVELCEKLHISNDDFIRTTEDRHKKVVRSILQDLYDRGEIYKDVYRGYYSTRQEQFVLEKERLEDGSWPEIYGKVEEIEETNYFFRLSKYQDWLISHLKENEFVFPYYRQKQVLEFLKEPINDLCISRPVERLDWGIRMPFDENYVTYVWFDALINYITGAGFGTDEFDEFWPCDFHVIGKDILVPAHAVYWPIMLKAIGVEPPKSLLVHGWWHIGGSKMSKSSGVTIDPLEFAEKYGAEALRYFLIREMSVGQDSDFTEESFLMRYNGDLSKNLGNLVSRLLNMAGKNAASGLAPATVDEAPEKTLREAWAKTKSEIVDAYEGFLFHRAMELLFEFCNEMNRYLEARQPWMLAKSEDAKDQEILQTSLSLVAEGLRLTAALLKPVMPEMADRISELLGQASVELWEGQLEWGNRLDGTVLGKKTILFPRPEVAK